MVTSQEKKRPVLICWFDALPRASAGSFHYLESAWKQKVIFLVMHDMDEAHRKIGWKDHIYPNEVIVLSRESNPDQKVQSLLAKYPDAIHYMNGFRSATRKYLYDFLLPNKCLPLIVWSEIPCLMNPAHGSRINWFRYLVFAIYYRYLAIRYNGRLKAYMPLGHAGVERFVQWGWNKEKLFPSMYCPMLPEQLPVKPRYRLGDKIRFAYFGRFSKLKGVNFLPSVFDRFKSENWTLDLYGANGNYEEELIRWAGQRKQVTYCGTCSSDEVISRISNYDVVIVPSRYEGWNLLPNESFWAGVGVIASDATISHELITASGGGIVFKAGKISEFHRAIEQVLNNPELINIWHERILSYRTRIHPEQVAGYWADVLDYLCVNTERKRPECPWYP